MSNMKNPFFVSSPSTPNVVAVDEEKQQQQVVMTDPKNQLWHQASQATTTTIIIKTTEENNNVNVPDTAISSMTSNHNILNASYNFQGVPPPSYNNNNITASSYNYPTNNNYYLPYYNNYNPYSLYPMMYHNPNMSYASPPAATVGGTTTQQAPMIQQQSMQYASQQHAPVPFTPSYPQGYSPYQNYNSHHNGGVVTTSTPTVSENNNNTNIPNNNNNTTNNINNDIYNLKELHEKSLLSRSLLLNKVVHDSVDVIMNPVTENNTNVHDNNNSLKELHEKSLLSRNSLLLNNKVIVHDNKTETCLSILYRTMIMMMVMTVDNLVKGAVVLRNPMNLSHIILWKQLMMH